MFVLVCCEFGDVLLGLYIHNTCLWWCVEFGDVLLGLYIHNTCLWWCVVSSVMFC